MGNFIYGTHTKDFIYKSTKSYLPVRHWNDDVLFLTWTKTIRRIQYDSNLHEDLVFLCPIYTVPQI